MYVCMKLCNYVCVCEHCVYIHVLMYVCVCMHTYIVDGQMDMMDG